MQRPLDIYEKISAEKGLYFKKRDDSVEVAGKLESGEYTVRGDISSQFISGLLFALSGMECGGKIQILPPFESRPYVDITMSVLKKFGAHTYYENEYTITAEGGNKFLPCTCEVEGDWSNAAFLEVFNRIGGNVKVCGLDENSAQGDKIYRKYFDLLDSSAPTLDISDCPDLAPVLIALASLKNGATLTGTRRLAAKESDRGSAMADEMAKFGVKIQSGENAVYIPKCTLQKPKEALCGHNDHRIVMALSTVLTVTGGVIEDAQAVNKSFPSYFETIKKLNAQVELK